MCFQRTLFGLFLIGETLTLNKNSAVSNGFPLFITAVTITVHLLAKVIMLIEWFFELQSDVFSIFKCKE